MTKVAAVIVSKVGTERTEGAQLAAGLIWFQFMGTVIATTKELAAKLTAEMRQKAYAARRDEHRAIVNARGQAAVDDFEAKFLAELDVLTPVLQQEMETTSARLRHAARRDAFLSLGYATGCKGSEDCPSLLSPKYNQEGEQTGNYEYCRTHQPTKAN